jgi:uncharacterized Ntn-hydrolase superfamily protein
VRRTPLLTGFLVLVFASSAHATYSIVAADTRTHRTGGAGTSCLDGEDVFIIHGVLPGVGTIHAQATFNREARDRGVELLMAGRTPSEMIAELTSPVFDAQASLRQYGIASVLGATGAYTGQGDRAFAGDRQGMSGTLVYSVQGNILTSSAVIEQAASAFEATGCDLPERLMRALEAGAEHGEGDGRCTSTRGIPSDSAFLRIAAGNLESDPYLELRVPTSGDANPLAQLRSELDAWRTTHPCDEDDKAGPPDAGGASAGRGGAGTGAAETVDSGCGCHLPRGRTTGGLGGWIAAAAAGLGARRRRGREARRVPGALSRQ